MKNNSSLNFAIIHGFAIAHALTAGALSQTLFGDEAALTALTVAMIVTVAKINGANWDEADGLAFLGIISGYYLGVRGAVFLIKWIPGIGNVANAATTFAVTEIIGWSTCYLVSIGKKPNEITKNEAKHIYNEGRRLKEENEKLKQKVERMNSFDKKMYKSYIEKLKNINISESEREDIIINLESLMDKY